MLKTNIELKTDMHVPIRRLIFSTVTLQEQLIRHCCCAAEKSGIGSLNPSSACEGDAAFPLVVTGRDFVVSSVVKWNGSERPTSFVNSTRLTAQIPASDIATAGTATVTVFNPVSGEVSAPLSFRIDPSFRATITELNPNSARAGGSDFALTVNGTGFVQDATVQWNGSNRPTTFVSETELKAAISALDIGTEGIAKVTVFKEEPCGGTSNELNFTVNPRGPGQANLSIKKKARVLNRGRVIGGSTVKRAVRYTINVINGGPMAAANVIVRDTPERKALDGFPYDFNPDVWVIKKGPPFELEANLGTLEVGKEHEVILEYTADIIADSAINTAYVSSDMEDPDPENNHDSFRVTKGSL